MLRRALVVATLLSTGFGCTSSDFSVPASGDASNSETSDIDSMGSEGGGETVIGPCDPEPGIAKYCIEVKLAKPEHPPYTTGSGASGLGIDGIGRVIVVLWDTDPLATKPGEMEPVPRSVIPFPSESGTLNVDTELPVTVSGAAPPGTYTIASLFADNLSAPREKGDVLPGDFVVVPNVVAGKASFPKITLTPGTVEKVTLQLQANRRIAATFAIDPTFATSAKGFPTIHGDGPTMLAIFDSEVSDFSGYRHVGFGRCVETKIQTVPTAPTVDFTTTVEGEHNVMMALFDYTSEPWPGRGTLVTKRTSPYPRIKLLPDQWSTSLVLDAVEVAYGPFSDTSMPDPLTCK